MSRSAALFALGFLAAGIIPHTFPVIAADSPTFQFKDAGMQAWRVQMPSIVRRSQTGDEWLEARLEGSEAPPCEIGSRIVLRLKDPAKLASLTANRPLQHEETMFGDCFILRAPDALTAAQQAHALARIYGVIASVPDMRRPAFKHFAYGAAPNDPLFPKQNGAGVEGQWHLENRSSTGAREGIDLNVRGAWAFTKGAGVVIGVGDDGVELTHPDLLNVGQTDLHFDFFDDVPGGFPDIATQAHGTAVAGLIIAEADNQTGVSGVAPEAKYASFPIFGLNGGGSETIASGVQLAKMYTYESNRVDVQNHSWGNAAVSQLAPSQLEMASVSNAVHFGRNELGVVMVRSGGNNRESNGDTNDDGYANSPFAIAVAAIREDGRASSYSNPGACLLVGAPSGDTGMRMLTTTDRVGTIGFNRASGIGNLSDYAYGGTGFSGTSGAAPQIAGIVALILSANPALSYRDVQQVLLHAARQTDSADPDLKANAAGFAFSHNSGFGVPDAGHAVRLCMNWPNRPAVTEVSYSAAPNTSIPDDALRVTIPGVPAAIASIPSTPGIGIVPDEPTATVELVDVGQATSPIAQDLTGKAALIRRGENFFFEKIDFAAQAGALFAVVYNNVKITNVVQGVTNVVEDRITMAATDYNPIPAVFINNGDGEALRDHIANNSPTLGRLQFDKATVSVAVNDSLLLEHVGVRVTTTHPRRGDVRLTLVSPQGTRSVLRRSNFDNSAGPANWTFWTAKHFYEPSAGVWRVEVGDARENNSGSVTSVDLFLRGVAITDSDGDGLDDGWENTFFAHLGNTAVGDPDNDGYSNAREQIMGTDPTIANEEFKLDLTDLKTDQRRLSWPAVEGRNYEVLSSADLGANWTTNAVNGSFPEAEHIFDSTGINRQFFQLREVSP